MGTTKELSNARFRENPPCPEPKTFVLPALVVRNTPCPEFIVEITFVWPCNNRLASPAMPPDTKVELFDTIKTLAIAGVRSVTRYQEALFRVRVISGAILFRYACPVPQKLFGLLGLPAPR